MVENTEQTGILIFLWKLLLKSVERNTERLLWRKILYFVVAITEKCGIIYLYHLFAMYIFMLYEQQLFFYLFRTGLKALKHKGYRVFSWKIILKVVVKKMQTRGGKY